MAYTFGWEVEFCVTNWYRDTILVENYAYDVTKEIATGHLNNHFLEEVKSVGFDINVEINNCDSDGDIQLEARHDPPFIGSFSQLKESVKRFYDKMLSMQITHKQCNGCANHLHVSQPDLTPLSNPHFCNKLLEKSLFYYRRMLYSGYKTRDNDVPNWVKPRSEKQCVALFARKQNDLYWKYRGISVNIMPTYWEKTAIGNARYEFEYSKSKVWHAEFRLFRGSPGFFKPLIKFEEVSSGRKITANMYLQTYLSTCKLSPETMGVMWICSPDNYWNLFVNMNSNSFLEFYDFDPYATYVIPKDYSDDVFVPLQEQSSITCAKQQHSAFELDDLPCSHYYWKHGEKRYGYEFNDENERCEPSNTECYTDFDITFDLTEDYDPGYILHYFSKNEISFRPVFDISTGHIMVYGDGPTNEAGGLTFSSFADNVELVWTKAREENVNIPTPVIIRDETLDLPSSIDRMDYMVSNSLNYFKLLNKIPIIDFIRSLRQPQNMNLFYERLFHDNYIREYVKWENIGDQVLKCSLESHLLAGDKVHNPEDLTKFTEFISRCGV